MTCFRQIHVGAFAFAIALQLMSTAMSEENIQVGSTVGEIQRFDPAIDKLIPKDAKIEVLGTGYQWSEGPVWWKAEKCLLFSDVPGNRIHQFVEGQGVSVFMEPSGYTASEPFEGRESGSNGLAFDRQGRLVMCCHGDHSVVRIEKDGTRTVLADSYRGKRLNSPNDLVVHSSGAIYFTDPPYGLPKPEAQELDFLGIYRISPAGELTLLHDQMTRPNGLAFSPDEKILYVAQSFRESPIWNAFPVKEDGSLGAAQKFFDASEWYGKLPGSPDGMKVDVHGNVWATGPGGVYVISPHGTLLGRIRTGQRTANCAFGADGSTLYMTAHRFICRIPTATKGMGF